jgi:hypothetical protein
VLKLYTKSTLTKLVLSVIKSLSQEKFYTQHVL